MPLQDRHGFRAIEGATAGPQDTYGLTEYRGRGFQSRGDKAMVSGVPGNLGTYS
ncbi:hypothetical protein DPMN_104987 [Dreissena polymorpha]|uniref:Uncharacterized protein n=1 Tax=Dreissena polymorpha TaxID=45954 RepID=A0A9D4HBH8_DREPO|nr:hypothetical protein DPMN_104987 [Dreissena polymorpha]